ncbi:MAG: hypothetical protein H7263_07900 [Candidatus Sericytochromatia bacterium]|nr:hypothetical protein [Candidatus Sericytochromatia bacterium]
MEIPVNNIEKLERLTKRERLGEMLLRSGTISLSLLTDLMNEHKLSVHGPFGEFLVDKDYITRKKLLELLNLQKVQDKVIDNCLDELGFMTNEKKWEKITRSDKLGEILIKQGKISILNLISSMDEQSRKPEKLIGEILLEKGLVNQPTLDQAIETQKIQSGTLVKTINEIINVGQIPIRVKFSHLSSTWDKF